MNKPTFKLVDDKGRILIPAPLRASLGLTSGDVVAITAERGSVIVKKAVVVDRDTMPMAAKVAYAETVAREMDDNALTDLLELAVRLLQERKSK